MSRDVETYYEFGAWRNWADGRDLGEPQASRDDAVAVGRREAAQRNALHIVRDEEGTVVDRIGHE